MNLFVFITEKLYRVKFVRQNAHALKNVKNNINAEHDIPDELLHVSLQ